MKRVVLLLFIGIVVYTRWIDSTAVIPGDLRTPRCEARAMSAVGRLNIESSAKNYGVSKPCEALLDLYISKKTSLKSLSGVVSVFERPDSRLLKHQFHIVFDKPLQGMLQQDIAVAPVNGHSCRDLSFTINSLTCLDDADQVITCPAIRLKTSMVFQDLLIDDDGVDVCFDD